MNPARPSRKEMLPTRFLLRFSDPDHEAGFVTFYTQTYQRYAQFSLALGVVLLLGDFLVDYFAFPGVGANFQRLQWHIPLLAAALGFSFTPLARKTWEPVMSWVIVATAYLLFWTLLGIDAQDGQGLGSWVGILNFTILELYCFVILGIRFSHALPVGGAILLGFFAAMGLDRGTPAAEKAYMAYHVLTMAVIAGGIGWWREFLLRKDYFAKFALEKAREAAERAAQASQEASQRKEKALSLMEATLNATDNGILVVDRQGKLTLMNRRLAEMWRIPDSLLAAHDDQQVLRHFVDQLAEPEQFLEKVRHLDAQPGATLRDILHFHDGRVFARAAHPQRLGEEIIGRVWSFLDISDQYRAEQRVLQLSRAITAELEQSERQRGQLDALLNAIPDLVWMKSLDGVFLSCNPAFAQLLDAGIADILGKSDHELFPREMVETARADDRKAIQQDAPVIREEWLDFRNDGRRSLVETVKTAVRGQDGKVLGVLGIARDITHQRALLDEVEQARCEAQASNAAKSTFLANMTHEIRTPMSAIIGMADLCLATPLNERQRNYLDKIKSASDALLHVINEILDFSKIEAGKLRMENIPFVLETVFDQLSNITALRAENLGIELGYEIDDGHLLLLGDPMRLGQVLTNLVTNALKFSTRGSVLVKVARLGVAEGQAELHFSVRDEGIGMSAEQAERLFLPFSQADSSTTRRYGGTGLGLAICHHMVGLMGGRIWVESQPGAGSTFHFTARFGTSGVDRRQGIGRLADQLALHAHRPVMVVDDCPSTLHIVSNITAQLGLRVDTADSGGAALELATAAAAPDYLAYLVDWRMPGIDGLETIHRLREIHRARNASPPLMLLMTAYSHHESLEHIDGQIDGLLAKPVSARHIYVELARCLGVFTAPPPDIDRRRSAVQQWSRFRHLDILLVEDVELNQEVITELLANVGLGVRLAANGAEALDAVARKAPDLILMDCQMPVMDGYTATRRLRENPAWQKLPIIAISANAMVEDQERCFAAGMNAHVSKPIQMDVLYERMLQCVPGRAADADREPPPRPAAAADGGTPAALPELPGIVVDIGLARVGGKPALFINLLKQFRDNQGRHFEPRIAAAAAADDWNAVGRLAHSLKGVAYTLGAIDLGDAASDLQSAADQGDAALGRARMAAVVERLRRVAAGLAPID